MNRDVNWSIYIYIDTSYKFVIRNATIKNISRLIAGTCCDELTLVRHAFRHTARILFFRHVSRSVRRSVSTARWVCARVLLRQSSHALRCDVRNSWHGQPNWGRKYSFNRVLASLLDMIGGTLLYLCRIQYYHSRQKREAGGLFQ